VKGLIGPLLLLAAGCASSVVDERLLPPSAREVVEAPGPVRAFRIHAIPLPPGTGAKDWPDVPTTAEVQVPPELERQLRRLLLDPAGYDMETGKGCIPSPGVKFRFSRGADTVEAYVCLQCAGIAFYGHGANGGEAWGNLESNFLPLVDLIAKLFPDDVHIRKFDHRR